MYFDLKWSQLNDAQKDKIKNTPGLGSKQAWQDAKAKAGYQAHHSANAGNSTYVNSGSSGGGNKGGGGSNTGTLLTGGFGFSGGSTSSGSGSGSAWSKLTDREKSYWQSKGFDKASFNDKYGIRGQTAPAVPSNWNSSSNAGPSDPGFVGPQPPNTTTVETINPGVTLTPDPPKPTGGGNSGNNNGGSKPTGGSGSTGGNGNPGWPGPVGWPEQDLSDWTRPDDDNRYGQIIWDQTPGLGGSNGGYAGGGQGGQGGQGGSTGAINIQIGDLGGGGGAGGEGTEVGYLGGGGAGLSKFDPGAYMGALQANMPTWRGGGKAQATGMFNSRMDLGRK